jgi:hypothetical protein
VLPAAQARAAGADDRLARLTEDTRRDAAHDAFMAFWRGMEGDQVFLWVFYYEAQER